MKMVQVNSSNIAAVGYEGNTLVIDFHSGGTYAYYGVPATVYQALMAAPSHGKYHARNIKYVFPYQRIR